MADTKYAVKSGFYDSVNHDRLYSADDMNQPYKSMLSAGIIEGGFAVTPQSTPDMTVIVAAGHALLGDKWVDAAAKTLTVPENTALYGRIDAVVLRVDINTGVRAADLIYRTGTPASEPEAPALIGTTGIYEVRLANITVAAGATAIAAAQISDQRGTSGCPYVTMTVGNTQIKAAVEDVLEAHPEWTTTVEDGSITLAKLAAGVIDNTLTQAGAAADAKKTGDEISGLKDALDNKVDKGIATTPTAFSITKGKFLNSSGEEVSSANYIICEADLSGVVGMLVVYSLIGSGNAKYAFYDNSDVAIEIATRTGSEALTKDIVEIPANAVKVKVTGKKDTPASIPTIAKAEYQEKMTITNGGVFSDLLVPKQFTEIPYSWTQGGFSYSNNQYVEQTDNKFMVLSVVAGEFYHITGNSYYSYNLVGLVISGQGITWIPNASTTAHRDMVIRIPDGCYKMIVQQYGTNTTKVEKATGFASGRIFDGKKVAIIGDSTVAYSTEVPVKWHNNIANLTGLNVVNLGISGTGYKKGEANSKAYYQRLSSIPNDVDAVVIFGSGNDNDQTAGDVSDTTTDTVLGCVNKTINDLISLYPTMKIGVITAYPWQSFKPANSNAMQNIADGIVQICRNNSIPVLDLYHESNVRPWIADNNTALFLNADGCHLNVDGHKVVTPIILEFFKTLLLEY